MADTPTDAIQTVIAWLSTITTPEQRDTPEVRAILTAAGKVSYAMRRTAPLPPRPPAKYSPCPGCRRKLTTRQRQRWKKACPACSIKSPSI